MNHPTDQLLNAFAFPGRLHEIESYGSGHIHDTYHGRTNEGDQFIIQRFNTNVFPRPHDVAENILAVTSHLQASTFANSLKDPHRRVLTMIPTQDSQWMQRDMHGNIWRAFRYIHNTRTYDEVKTSTQAYTLGKTFGQFQVQLLDFRGRLHETIPNFHNTRKRFTDFEYALRGASAERIAKAHNCIQFAIERESIVDILLRHEANGDLPTRITHNDTKVNNLLFDSETQEGICVIDLDTVMPGLSLYDFGDMVRTGVVTAPESETNFNKIDIVLDRFAALVEGYLTATQNMLTDLERKLLVFSGRLLTFETGMRFLTDYLKGDVYFKIHYPEQNLDRCRNQFRLVKKLEQKNEKMNAEVSRVWSKIDQPGTTSNTAKRIDSVIK